MTYIQNFKQNNSGQILISVVFFLFVLISCLALTVNVGDRINKKIRMQNAADAFAIEGGLWFARALNMISILNISMAETLSSIIMLKAIDKANAKGKCILNSNISEASESCAEGNMSACRWLDKLIEIGVPGIDSIDEFYDDELRETISDLWEIMEWLEKGEDQINAYSNDMPLIADIASSEGEKIAKLNGAEMAFWLPKKAGLPVKKGELTDFSEVLINGGSGVNNFLQWNSILDMKSNNIKVRDSLKYLWLTYNESGPGSEGPDTSPLIPPVSSIYNSEVDKVFHSLGKSCGWEDYKPLLLTKNWQNQLNFLTFAGSKKIDEKLTIKYKTNVDSYDFSYNEKYEGVYAIAQVIVYNPNDKDLFNQEWMAKLVPFNPDLIDFKKDLNNSTILNWIDQLILLKSIIVH